MKAVPVLRVAAPALFAAGLTATGPPDSPRQLTFDQRVEAQKAIERVYYSHQEGATRPFDEAVPRDVLEEKVRKYLKQSVALEKFWRTPVTAEALQREMERIGAGTVYPARLGEVYEALDNDAFLIQETLARATLVTRLTRNFFAFDDRIHGQERREAEELNSLLRSRRLDVESDHHRRRVIERTHAESGPEAPTSVEWAELEQDPASPPGALDRIGDIGSLMEEPEAFVTRVVLSNDGRTTRHAEYVVPKRSWGEWWVEVEAQYREGDVTPVAAVLGPAAAEGAWRRHSPRTGSSEPAGALAIAPPRCRAEDTWDNGSLDDGPEPLNSYYGHSAVWSGAEMLVWISGRGFSYDPALDTWRRLSMPGVPRGRSAFWTGDDVLVWNGGEQCGGRYDPRRGTWTPISCEGSPPDGSAVWTGNEMLVWRGPLSPGARYSPTADRWTPMAVGGAVGNGSIGTVWTGREMIVLGYPAGARYHPATDTWSPMSPFSIPATDCNLSFNVAWTGRQVIVWGIADQYSCDDDYSPIAEGAGGRYDPASDTWNPMSSQGARTGFGSAVWTGRHLIIWGGYDGEGWVNSGARYSPEADTWTRMSEVNAPEGRSHHSAVWTGDRMIVWGGRERHTAGTFSSGGRYDPVTDSWTPTSVTNAGQPPRSGHAAIWTGTEMVVWDKGSGGRYDPLTDSWRLMTSVGAPRGGGDARDSALWTGSEMLVWNAASRSSPGPLHSPAEGGRYDPVADRWRPMSVVGAPVEYVGGSAIWTGTEMIVWGTNHIARCCPWSHTVGRYNLASDTWRPVSTDGAPPPGHEHRALWTGRKMIIWRGALEAGRYDPLTDRWTGISSDHAPPHGGPAVWTGQEMIVLFRDPDGLHAGSYNPTTDSWKPSVAVGTAGGAAVWTGREMIVWGSGGERYDPATDSWKSISSIGQPSQRWGHTAVWAGNQMIVWGGEVFDASAATGGRYFPDGEDSDNDADGVTVCSGDCHDGDAGISPATVELPGNAVDENCDGIRACDPGGNWRSRGQLIACVTSECGRLARQGQVKHSLCPSLLAGAREAPMCGDSVKEGSETCDGRDLGGANCQLRGFDAGTLLCNEACNGFDVSGCHAVCGDGLIRGTEVCDGSALGGETCMSWGFREGTLACNDSCDGIDTSGCARCGDALRQEWEDCEGDDLRGLSCRDLGFDGGALGCNSACRLDSSGCTTVCGDGIRRGTEACDGADVAPLSCQSLGFTQGTLACEPDCMSLDSSDCSGRCGNGVREGVEECDGMDLAGASCRTEGFDSGTLWCQQSCQLARSSCVLKCGNGIRGGNEVCDKLDVGDAKCSDFGFNMGKVICNKACTAYDLSVCSTCGDGIWEGLEVCDGPDLGGETCESRGQLPGTLQCNPTCNGFIYTGCTGL